MDCFVIYVIVSVWNLCWIELYGMGCFEIYVEIRFRRRATSFLLEKRGGLPAVWGGAHAWEGDGKSTPTSFLDERLVGIAVSVESRACF